MCQLDKRQTSNVTPQRFMFAVQPITGLMFGCIRVTERNRYAGKCASQCEDESSSLGLGDVRVRDKLP